MVRRRVPPRRPREDRLGACRAWNSAQPAPPALSTCFGSCRNSTPATFASVVTRLDDTLLLVANTVTASADDNVRWVREAIDADAVVPMLELANEPSVAQSGAEAGGVRRYLLVVGLVFPALVMALTPDVGFTAPPTGRLLFWTLQTGVGLLVLPSVLRGITRLLGATRVSSWVLVVLTGLLGSIPLAPVYWLIGEGKQGGEQAGDARSHDDR